MIKKMLFSSVIGFLFSTQAMALPSNTFVFREPLKHVKASNNISGEDNQEDNQNNNQGNTGDDAVNRDDYEDGFFGEDDEGGEPSDIDYIYAVSVKRGLGGLQNDARGISGSTTANGSCSVDLEVDTLPVSDDSIIIRYSTDFGALSKTKQVVYKGHNNVIADKVKIASSQPGVATVRVWQEGVDEVFERKVYFYDSYTKDVARYDANNYIEVFEDKTPYVSPAQTIMTRAYRNGLEVSPSNFKKGSPFAETTTTSGVTEARRIAMNEGVQTAYDINQISRYQIISAYTEDCGRQR